MYYNAKAIGVSVNSNLLHKPPHVQMRVIFQILVESQIHISSLLIWRDICMNSYLIDRGLFISMKQVNGRINGCIIVLSGVSCLCALIF